MAITDKQGYVKTALAGMLALVAVPSIAFAESKFLSIGRVSRSYRVTTD